MEIVQYSPNRFDELCKAVDQLQRGKALAIAEIVHHYYCGNEWGQLWLALEDVGRTIAGTMGTESIPFVLGGESVDIGFSSNFHSLAEGAGGLLFLKWSRSNRFSMTYNGSSDTRRLTDAQRWQALGGVISLSYNEPPDWENPPSGVARIKQIAKRALRLPPLRKVIERKRNTLLRAGLTVEEIPKLTPESITFSSPFDFRIAPDFKYLSWRYNCHWPCFQYRYFSILKEGRVRGLVIAHITDNQTVIAHADGESPREIAEGIILTLAAIDGPSSYHLASSVPEVVELCQIAGFKSNPKESRLFFNSRFPIEKVQAPLINFGMGDNDLRPEFISLDSSST